jgi:transcriptional regulator GlxA family with amidase domain
LQPLKILDDFMNFGFLIFPDLEELDLVGPWEIIRYWSQFAQGPENCLMIAEKSGPVICNKGMSINPHIIFSDCPTLDYLLVPGGQGTRKEVDNQVLVHFVTTQAKNCRAVLAVCTGAFILHRAGLLSGLRATTHWASLDRLRNLGDVTVVEERIVRDGPVWTSAGVSAGIDLALAFIADAAGEETAGSIQFGVEYYPVCYSYGVPLKHEKTPQYIQRDFRK